MPSRPASAAAEAGLASSASRRLLTGSSATAASYVVSPKALGPAAADPARGSDRLSASYLIALAARVVREVGDLVHRSREAEQRLPTLSMDAEIRFRSPSERAAFTEELTRAVTGLVARYHDPVAPGGRPHRLLVLAHPLPRAAQSRAPDEVHPRTPESEERSCP